MFYIIPTPIGNFSDITLRALDVLKEVDIIACENPLISLKLLNKYDIKKTLIKYHKFNEKQENEKIINLLKNGKNIALISDAGMPLISDPGNDLIHRIREEKLEYTCLPGACALITAIVLSGFEEQSFYFNGFLLGTKSKKIEKLNELKDVKSLLVFYMAPHDIAKDLDLLFRVFGSKKTRIIREISKVFEQVIDFQLGEKYTGEERGEFVVIVDNSEKESNDNQLSIEQHVQKYVDMGIEKKDAIKIVAKERGVAKSVIYKNTID